MHVPSPSRPRHRWAMLSLCGVALAAGVAGAAPAPAIGPVWSALYDAPAKDNSGADIIVDNAGNSYAVGLSVEDRDNPDAGILVVKYNAAGQRQWASSVGALGGVNTDLTAVADSQGNVIAAGSVYDSDAESESLFVAKFNSAGNVLWDAAFDTMHAVGGLAVDSSGNAYVAGAGVNEGDASEDAVVLKVAGADGDLLWEARASGDENTEQSAADVVVDSAGGVFFTGSTRAVSGGSDILTVKLDAANGSEVWSTAYDAADSEDDFGTAIAITPSGIAVAGSVTLDGTQDFAAILYNTPDGEEIWASFYDGPADENNYDEAVDLALDSTGNIHVTGVSYGTGSALSDLATVKFGLNDGALLWAARYNGPGAESEDDFVQEAPREIVVDAGGNVYVTGDLITGNSRTDIGTLKYNSAGQQQWVHSYNGRALSDYGGSLALDGAGNVYVSGTVFTNNEREDRAIAVLKYLPTGRGTATPAPRIPKPTFTFSESAKDKLICFREEGETFCDEVTTATFKVNSTATMQDVDITSFDEETTFALSVGGLELERTLGDDPRYTPGKTKATFTETVFDDNDRERKALTVTLSWPRGKLKVGVVSTPYFEEGIMAGDFLDAETAKITDTTTATVSLGDFTQEFEVAVKGKVTTRPSRDEEYFISTVTLTGKGAGL